MTDDLEALRYPLGRFSRPDGYNEALLKDWIARIEILPRYLDPLIENLDAAQLEVPYRDGGWTVQQVIHHVADSHMQAYGRLKLALTEENPVVKPYDENRWAELPDVQDVPVNVSITLLHALHRRWAAALRLLQAGDWERAYIHPEQNRAVPIWEMTALYAWHGRHHVEQVRLLRERMGW